MGRNTVKILAVGAAVFFLSLLFPLSSHAAGEVAINKTNFPDDSLRGYVSAWFDHDNNGSLSAAEINNCTEIDCIINTSAKGLSYFTKLETLKLYSYDSVTSLDLSKLTALKYLDISHLPLTSLDLSKNVLLEELCFDQTRFTSLDLSANTRLTTIFAEWNQLNSLNITKCTELVSLNLPNNQLTSLNLSKCTKLQEVILDGNPLTSLNVSKCTKLKKLQCEYCNLLYMDVSSCTALQELSLYYNSDLSSEVDVSNCTELSVLNLKCTRIPVVDVSKNRNLTVLQYPEYIGSVNVRNNKNLVELNVSTCDLTSLDISQNTKLRKLECSFNNLSQIDLSHSTELETLAAWHTPLAALDLSKNKKLKELSIRGIPLKKLNLSANTELEFLYCRDCSLTSLDVSKMSKLRSLYCLENEISSLDLSNCRELLQLSCDSNKLSSLDISACTMLKTLIAVNNPIKTIDISALHVSLFFKDPDPADYTIFSFSDDSYGGVFRINASYVDMEGNGDTYEIQIDETTELIAMDKPSLSVSNTASGIKLSWGKIAGAQKYRIYRKTEGENYKQVKTVTSKTWTDTGAAPGGSYDYKVRAEGEYAFSNYSSKKTIVRNPFTDVSSDASYYSAVMWAVANGITSGTSPTTFSPTAPCTRYQLAVMLYRLAGKPAVSDTTLPFTDVPANASYRTAVAWAYKNNIIKGTSTTEFSPNTEVTRYQVVSMLYKMAGKPAVSGTNPFTDVSASASYYKAVLWAVQNNITKGTSATTFSPMATCQRYQMAVFLNKFNKIYHFK